MKIISLIIIAFLSLPSLAAEGDVLSFSRWKLMQQTEAQNKVVRNSNALLLIKSDRIRITDALPTIAEETKEGFKAKASIEEITEKEQELKRSIEALEFAKELTFEDYMEVYLSQYMSNSDALRTLAADLSANDVVKLIEYALKKQKGDVQQNIGVATKSLPSATEVAIEDAASKL